MSAIVALAVASPDATNAARRRAPEADPSPAAAKQSRPDPAASTNPRSEPPELAAKLAAFLLCVFALAAPWSIAISEGAVVGLAALTLACVLLRRPPAGAWHGVHLALLAFLVAQAISIPLGVHPERSLRCFRGSWVMLFLFPFTLWLGTRRLRHTALALLVGSGALAGLYGLVQFFMGRDLLHDRDLLRAAGDRFVAVGNLNSHLTYAGVLLPLSFVALGWLADRRGRQRALLAGAAALLAVGVVVSFTRSAWIGAAAGAAIVLLSFGTRTLLIGLAACGALLGGLLLSQPGLRDRLLSIGTSGDDPRWRLWQTALRIGFDHPWFGAGLGAFKSQFPVYRVPGEYMSTVHPHHDLLNVFVETGLVGTLAWGVIWVLCLAALRSHIARVRPSRMGHGLAVGLTGAIAALLVAGLSQCYQTDEEVAQVLWFLVAVSLAEARASDPHPRPLGKRIGRGFKSRALPLLASVLGGRRAHWSGPPLRLAPRGAQSSIVVVKSDNRLGNLLLLSPFLRRLREAAPDARITWVVGEEYAALLRAWPWADELRVEPKRRHARAPWTFVPWAGRLRATRPDLAFEMSNHHTHSFWNSLLTLVSGAPHRVGFDDPRNRPALTLAVPAPEDRLHFSLAPLAFLRALGWPAAAAPMRCPLPDRPDSQWRTVARQQGLESKFEPGDAYGVVHLGGRDRKAWPLDAWRQLLPALLEEGTERLVLVAGPEERERLAAVLDRASNRLVIAPPLDVIELGQVLQSARFFVGCDSGVLHFAAALEVPTVSLFFRSNPYHYAPLGPRHRVALLANPYAVTEEEWHRRADSVWLGPDAASAAERFARAKLFRAELDPLASAEGIPESGARAQSAILRAVGEIRSLPRSTEVD